MPCPRSPRACVRDRGRPNPRARRCRPCSRAGKTPRGRSRDSRGVGRTSRARGAAAAIPPPGAPRSTPATPSCLDAGECGRLALGQKCTIETRRVFAPAPRTELRRRRRAHNRGTRVARGGAYVGATGASALEGGWGEYPRGEAREDRRGTPVAVAGPRGFLERILQRSVRERTHPAVGGRGDPARRPGGRREGRAASADDPRRGPIAGVAAAERAVEGEHHRGGGGRGSRGATRDGRRSFGKRKIPAPAPAHVAVASARAPTRWASALEQTPESDKNEDDVSMTNTRKHRGAQGSARWTCPRPAAFDDSSSRGPASRPCGGANVRV